MRFTISDVVRRPSRLSTWWLDTPWKRPRNWWTLLFEPGRGWLRWGMGWFDYTEPILEDGSGPTWSEPCDPPLRRLWHVVRWREPVWWKHGRDPDWPDGYLLP